MYSIIRQGGMQFYAEKGKCVDVPLMDAPVGSEIEIKDVLLFCNEKTLIGTPTVSGAAVKAKIVLHGRGPKVRIFKRKRRKRYRRTLGHRQDFTRLEITEMNA